MIVNDFATLTAVEALYEASGDDLDFRTIADHCQPSDDTELADLIELDGRYRIRTKRPIALERYLDAYSDLGERVEPLDAALDMALRWLASTAGAIEDAVDHLIAAHPELTIPIREAAALNDAVWSTSKLGQQSGLIEPKSLPCPFGPRTEAGECRYELREMLGAGAFGRVYLAVDRRLSEAGHAALVAIKIVAPVWHDTESTFSDEATKARRIAHPNVASVIDCGVSPEGEPYIVYENVAGGDLGHWHRRHAASLSLEDAALMTAKIARGVHAAHMAGLVHCDLKPNNVLLTDDGEPKVGDFGIAVRATATSTISATEDTPRGNLAFMSPEQYRMEPGALTIPTDVYALGGLLFWLVTRELPNGSTPAEIRRTHDEQRGRNVAPSIRNHRSADGDLDAICARALAPRAEDRYASAAELAADLEAWVARCPIAWRRPSPLRRLGLWTRRRPAIAAVAILTTMSVAVAVPLAMAAYTERRARDKANEDLGVYIGQLELATSQGLGHLVLTPLWAMEWMFGPTVLDGGENKLALFDLRLDIVEKLVAKRHAAGQTDDLTTALWETALAFWLIKDEDPERARAVLDETVEKWERLLDPDDPWLHDMRALHACCEVPTLDPAEVRDVAALIERSETRLASEAPGSPLQILFLEQLCVLYGPDRLDDDEKEHRLRARLEALLD